MAPEGLLPYARTAPASSRRKQLSYRARERKRRKRAAIARVKGEHSAAIAVRYYLTLATRACRCKACGGRL